MKIVPGSAPGKRPSEYRWMTSIGNVKRSRSNLIKKHAIEPQIDGTRSMCGQQIGHNWKTVEYGSSRAYPEEGERQRCEMCALRIRLLQGWKTCPHCNEEKPVTQYFVNSRAPSGISHWCKPCVSRENRAREYNLATKAVEIMGGRCGACSYAANDFALRVVPDLTGKTGREVARWWDQEPSRSWKAFMRRVLADGGEGFLVRCMNCIAIERREEWQDGGRKVSDFVP